MTPQQLMQAIIEISELPLPELPAAQLAKIDQFEGFRLGHAVGLMQACQLLRRYLEQERVIVGKAATPAEIDRMDNDPE